MSATAKKSDGIWDMVKLGLILAVYAVAACTVLAVVHNVTAPVIESNNLKKAAAVMKMVFPEADQFETADGFNGSTKSGNTVIGSINLAKKGGEILGAVAEISGPTYDRSTIMVGMDINGIVTGMRYLTTRIPLASDKKEAILPTNFQAEKLSSVSLPERIRQKDSLPVLPSMQFQVRR